MGVLDQFPAEFVKFKKEKHTHNLRLTVIECLTLYYCVYHYVVC